MYPTRTIRAASLFLCALLGASAAFPDAKEELHKTYTLQSGAQVTVENVNGTVSIAAWDSAYTDLRAVKRTSKDRSELEKVEIEITVDGGLRVKTVAHGVEGFLHRSYPRVSVDYTIRIPRTVMVQTVKNVNGDITLLYTAGDPSLYNTNGAVRTEGVRRLAKMKTVNGSIEVIGGSSIRDAETTNGSIQAALIPGSDPMNFSTVNGSITLSVSTGANADVDLRTVTGKIVIPDGFTLRRGEISRHLISGRLGSGGAPLAAKTVNGSITLEVR